MRRAVPAAGQVAAGQADSAGRWCGGGAAQQRKPLPQRALLQEALPGAVRAVAGHGDLAHQRRALVAQHQSDTSGETPGATRQQDTSIKHACRSCLIADARVLHLQVIALTFLLSIGLMIATFWVAWKLGAIRLNE